MKSLHPITTSRNVPDLITTRRMIHKICIAYPQASMRRGKEYQLSVRICLVSFMLYPIYPVGSNKQSLPRSCQVFATGSCGQFWLRLRDLFRQSTGTISLLRSRTSTKKKQEAWVCQLSSYTPAHTHFLFLFQTQRYWTF